MKGSLQYHTTLSNNEVIYYEGSTILDLWLIGGNSNHLYSPLSIWHNGSTYVVGYEDSDTLNQAIIIKQTGYVIEKNTVGNGTTAEEPNNHPTPILVISPDGYIYVIQNEFHVTPFRIWKSDAPEDISSFTYLGDFDTNGAYLVLMRQDGKYCRFATRSADAGESPNYFYASILSLDLDNPTEYSKVQLTDNNYTGTSVRHYVSAVFFYGTSDYRIGGINHRYDGNFNNYKTSIYITQDFVNIENFGQTFSKNVVDSGELTVAELETNFAFYGTDSSFTPNKVAYFIQVNDDLFITRRDDDGIIFIEKYTIGSTSLVAQYKLYMPNVVIVHQLYYNGERVVMLLAQSHTPGVQIYSIDTDLTPESWQYQRKIDDAPTIVYTGMPSNFDEVDGDYIIIGSSVGGDDGNVPYVITNDKWNTLNRPIVTEIYNLALDTAFGTMLNISWSIFGGQDVDHYDIYVDGSPNTTSTATNVLITGLTLNTSYDIKVRAVYEPNTNGIFSDTVAMSTASSLVYQDYIVSYWNFDANSNDQIGSNNGTDTSITYGIGGIVDNIATLNGTTSFISFAGLNSSFNGVDFSVSQWINTAQTSAFRLFQNRGAGALGTVAGFQISQSNNINWGNTIIDDGAGNYITFSAVPYNEDDNGWHHIVLTWDTSLGVGKFYIDGALKDTQTNVSLISANLNSLTVLAGKSNTSTQYFNGSFDESAVFSKELSSTEVAEIYAKNQAGLALTA